VLWLLSMVEAFLRLVHDGSAGCKTEAEPVGSVA
jgi:hypothetical protein